MYAILKDFAGPVATLVAAVTAIVVTTIFSRSQLLIARSQRDIAYDKLKFDLFKERSAIYKATRDLLEYVPFVTDIAKSDATKIRSLYITLDEARFFFPPDICRHLDAIHERCEAFFTHLAERDRISIDDNEKWAELADTLAKDQAALRAYFAELPKTFATSLAFDQLTAARK